MQSKHKIIGLTSLILTTTTSLLYAETQNHVTDNIFLSKIYAGYLGQHGEGGEAGEAGEGGESGEGGFDAKTLKTDDIAFGTALRVIHAHYLIGEKLYEAGDIEAASSFFGHPISEVLIELEPAFQFRNIESPENEMYALLEIAGQPDKLSELQLGIQKVMTKIDAAFDAIKLADKKQDIAITASINAELIRRSKLEYFEAISANDIGHLQDSIGYFEAAYHLFQKNNQNYQFLNKNKTDEILSLFDAIKPFFKNFKQIDKNSNHKKLAGLMAKIELYLSNI